MNKKYTTPEMDITEFDVEDVIMTSPAGGDDNGEDPGDDDDDI